MGTGYVALAAALVWKRDQLLGRDLGGSLPLALVGLVFYLAAVWLTVRTRRVLPFNVLAGVPEVSADAPGGLITEGVYAHVRHPRYASVILAVIGFALMVNYVGIFILTAFLVAAVLGLIPMEERELAGRFGDQYERYRERVPMLVPRLGSRAREPGGGLP